MGGGAFVDGIGILCRIAVVPGPEKKLWAAKKKAAAKRKAA
jgi:hypothetical protein